MVKKSKKSNLKKNLLIFIVLIVGISLSLIIKNLADDDRSNSISLSPSSSPSKSYSLYTAGSPSPSASPSEYSAMDKDNGLDYLKPACVITYKDNSCSNEDYKITDYCFNPLGKGDGERKDNVGGAMGRYIEGNLRDTRPEQIDNYLGSNKEYLAEQYVEKKGYIKNSICRKDECCKAIGLEKYVNCKNYCIDWCKENLRWKETDCKNRLTEGVCKMVTEDFPKEACKPWASAAKCACEFQVKV